MKFDNVTNLLHLVYSDCNRVYDVNGNLKDVYKRKDKSPEFRKFQEIVIREDLAGRIHSNDSFVYYVILSLI
jgi:hypothetical protein